MISRLPLYVVCKVLLRLMGDFSKLCFRGNTGRPLKGKEHIKRLIGWDFALCAAQLPCFRAV